jgi:hypothetical protein
MMPDKSFIPPEIHSTLQFDRPPRCRLALLDGRSIAVRFHVQGEERLLAGQGALENDRELGAILRIKFPADPDGGELLVSETCWTGEVESGDAVGCDFLIRLR